MPLKLEPADLKAKPGYFPMLVNDIMAARVELDKRSDKGKLNTSTVYLIGAGDAATIGMLYMTAEWTRPQKPSQDLAALIKQLPFPNVPPRESAGKDIAGAVWLSPVRPAIVSERTMQDWLKSVSDLRESNAVLCLYGDQDATGKATSTAMSIRCSSPTRRPRP